MSEVIAEIQIDAPPHRVWEVALDPNRLRDWVTIHRHLGRHDTGPPRKGFKMNQTLSLRGAPFRVKWELVECDEYTRAHWHGDGPAGSDAETEYRLSENDGGTLFSYRNEFHAPLGLLGRVAQRAVAGDVPQVAAHRSLERLKALCEHDGAGTSS
jgi:hypothetical protein